MTYGANPQPAVAENPVYRRYDLKQIKGTISVGQVIPFPGFNTVETQGHGFAQMWIRIKVISMLVGGQPGGSVRFRRRMQASFLGFQSPLSGPGDGADLDITTPSTVSFDVLTSPFLTATAVAPFIEARALEVGPVVFIAEVEGVIALGTYPMQPYRELEVMGRIPEQYFRDPVLRGF